MQRTYNRKFVITPLSVALLIAVSIACWIIGYLKSVGYPITEDNDSTIIWNILLRHIPNIETAYILGFLLLVAGGFFVQRANYALILLRERTMMPFWIYFLLGSTNSDFFPIRESSFGVFFFVMALYQLFISYHNPDARNRAFNAGWHIGLGSLLWAYLLWFLPLLWIGMYKLRSYSLKMVFSSFIGTLAVYWFIFGWCVWSGDYTILETTAGILLNFNPMNFPDTNLTGWLSIIYTTILVIIASANILTHEYEDNLRSRQLLSFLMITALWSFVMFFLYEESSDEFMLVIELPASLLIAHMFTTIRHRCMFWFYHGTIILFLLFFVLRVWNF